MKANATHAVGILTGNSNDFNTMEDYMLRLSRIAKLVSDQTDSINKDLKEKTLSHGRQRFMHGQLNILRKIEAQITTSCKTE